MSCTLAMIATCFQLSGIYVDVSGVIADSGVEQYGFERNHVVIVDRWGKQTSEVDGPASYNHRADNPYVRFALGYEVDISRRCSMYVEAWHMSSAATGKDHGTNAGAAGFHCRPWGGAR